MLSFSSIPRPARSSSRNAALIADYVQFDQQRRYRRQYIKAFGGMTILVLAGAVFRFVPARQAEVAAGLFAIPPITLGIIEALGWRQLVRRLGGIRAEIHLNGKS
jgi:hypothetical protein